jgi:hypothetical protein
MCNYNTGALLLIGPADHFGKEHMMSQMHSVKVADGDKAVRKGLFNVSEGIKYFHWVMPFLQLYTLFTVIRKLLLGGK